jgi:hypothetical protein
VDVGRFAVQVAWQSEYFCNWLPASMRKRILGPDDKRFILVGGNDPTRSGPSSGNHSDNAFWEHNGGRLYHGLDCVLRPDFIVGEYYLVFRGKPATPAQRRAYRNRAWPA